MYAIRSYYDPLAKGDPGPPLMGRLRCGNEEHLIQVTAIEYMPCQFQVPLMDRIKGAAEQADGSMSGTAVHPQARVSPVP